MPDAAPLVDALAQVDHGTGSVTGVVDGRAFAVMDSVSATVDSRGATPGTYAELFLTSTPGFCDDVEHRINRANSSVFAAQIVKASPNRAEAPTGPGTYTIATSSSASGPVATGGFLDYDAACAPTPRARATGGTVTVTSVVGDIYAGSFDLSLDTGEHVTGTFSPGGCPALDGPAQTLCR